MEKKIPAQNSDKESKIIEETEPAKTVEQIVNDYYASVNYVSASYYKTWESAWKLYNNIRVDEAYEGISNTFVPMTFSTIETMVSAIAGGKPEFEYVPTTGVQEQETKPLNTLLSYYWDVDKWTLKTITWVRNTLIYGTGIVYVYWDIDKPRLINVPLRDFIIDPEATEIHEARYVGRRYLTTKNALAEMQKVDPKTKKLIPMYTNLDKITDIDEPSGEETDKQRKDMLLGSTLSPEDSGDQIEVIEYWDTVADRVQCVANRTVLIRDDENPYKTQAKNLGHSYPEGIVPFIAQRDYIDESLFYGKGEVEPIKKEQELLNDITNQTSDSITYALNQMFTLDPRYADWIEKVENLPGAVYPFEAGALQPIQKGTIPNIAFEQIQTLKQEIRETTAASEIAKGTDQSVSNVTATQIEAQQASAGQRFGIKLTQFEEEGFHELGNVIFKMMQLFITKPIKVRSISDAGPEWITYDPKKYTGEYTPRVLLASTIRNNLREEQFKADSIFQSMINNPLVDQKALTKMYLMKRYDLQPDEIAGLLVQTDTSGPGVPPGAELTGQLGASGAQAAMQTMGAMPAGPQTPAPEMKASDLVKLYNLAAGQPDLQGEIVQMLGLTPSQFPDMVTSKHATEVANAIQAPVGQPQAPQTTMPGQTAMPMTPEQPMMAPTPDMTGMIPPITPKGKRNANRK